MIMIGSRVFYHEEYLKHSGFGLVVDVVSFPNVSEKYPSLQRHIEEKTKSKIRILVILKDNGQLEEFIESDCKTVVEI